MAAHHAARLMRDTLGMNLNPLALPTFVLATCFGVLLAMPARADRSAPESQRAAGECKSVATFVSSAVPALSRDGCTECHGGGDAAATKALDLRSIGKDNTAACAEALKRVSVANGSLSAIIQAPAGAQNHAGGKVKDRPGFTAALMGWIAHE